MPISTKNKLEQVSAISASFQRNILSILLSNGRTIGIPIDKIDWLQWLATATQEQQENWSLEPGGYAIYWNDLDNGIEIEHLLSMSPLI